MDHRARLVLTIFSGLVLPFGSACDDDDTVTCTFEGAEHAPGERFPAPDGCNTCFCSEDGAVGCTEMACTSSCLVDGVEHAHGTTFPSPDGCNTCSCDNGTVGCTAMACIDGCDHDGRHYDVGATFPAADGCNTCSCQPDGQVVCTLMPCVVTCERDGRSYQPGDTFPTDECNTCTCGGDGTLTCTDDPCVLPGCSFGGQSFDVGETFDAPDGCNTCTCTADGSIACTEIACPPACDPDAEWYRRYYGHSAEECAAIFFACVEWTVMFENECGCGCEHEQACDEVIECWTPDCDYNTVVTRCPFSTIRTQPPCSAEKPCPGQFGICAAPGSPMGCGICFRPDEGSPSCADDAACAAVEARSICEPLHCACDPGDRVCVPGCTSDDACGVGERCSESGRCVPAPCDGDAMCPSQFACNGGGCQRIPCETSERCGPAGSATGYCVLGLCYDEPGECRLPVP